MTNDEPNRMEPNSMELLIVKVLEVAQPHDDTEDEGMVYMPDEEEWGLIVGLARKASTELLNEVEVPDDPELTERCRKIVEEIRHECFFMYPETIGAAKNDVPKAASILLRELRAERVKVRDEAFAECARHIPTQINLSDDPKWIESRGSCSCKQVVADGVTKWEKLWSDHIRALAETGESTDGISSNLK